MKPDVLVIGGGAIGICSAYYLAEQGLQVSIVERNQIASGCSDANAGLIVPSYIIPLAAPGVFGKGLQWILKPESPFFIKPRIDSALFCWLWQFRKACKEHQMRKGLHTLHDLNYASLELINHLIAVESLDCNYRQDGWLMVYKTFQGFKKALKESHILDSQNIKLNILNMDEVKEIVPTLHPKITGGIFFPDDAHLDPALFVRSLADRLRKRGVTIHVQTEVLKFELSNGSVKRVQTTRGDFQPKIVVLAAGVWSRGLLKTLGHRLSIHVKVKYFSHQCGK